ncbi:MAG: YdcF family protein [Chloroflexi bacterium]|nr:YdcF family protein [Chloroflexota bacterium]
MFRKLIIASTLIVVMLIAAPLAWVFSRHSGLVYEDPVAVPPAPIAIVFGAGLRPDGQPSSMLSDRVDAAVALYRSGKVGRLLMSGDNRSSDYDEVTAMKQRAIARGVPAAKIDVDQAGLSTFDSVFRARVVFKVTEAILVSQGYHLPRALYFAQAFGIKAIGLKAGSDHYPGQTFYSLREAASLSIAWYEVNLLRHGLNRTQDR